MGFFLITFMVPAIEFCAIYNNYNYFIPLIFFFSRKRISLYNDNKTIELLRIFYYISMNILLIYCSIPHFDGQLPEHVQ